MTLRRPHSQAYALNGLRFALLCLLLTGCQHSSSNQAEANYAKAQEYLRRNQTNEALIELKRAIQTSPEMAKAHRQLAELYLRRGAGSEAMEQFSLTVRYAPDDETAYEAIGNLLLRERDYSKAEETAKQILAKWPSDDSAKLIEAESLIGLGDFKKADDFIAQVVQNDPNNARGRFDLAGLQIRNNDWGNAEKNLRLAWNLQPDGPSAPIALAEVLEREGRPDDSRSVLERAADSRGAQVPSLYALAGFYFRRRMLTEAEQTFKRIQDVDSTNPVSRGSLGRFYVTIGQLDAAEKELRRVVTANPEDKLNWLNLAETEVRLSRLTEAHQIADDLIRKDPKDWQALLLRAIVNIEDGKPDRALDDLNLARTIQPESPVLHFQLSRAYLAKADLNSAKAALNNALKYAPDFVAARTILGALELKQGETQGAINDLGRVVRQYPQLTEANVWLSQAYVKEGDFKLAESLLEHLLSSSATSVNEGIILQTLATVKFEQGHYNEAIEYATRSLAKTNRSRLALEVLGLSYSAEKQPNQGLEAVRTFIQKAGDWAAGQQTLGELALRASDLNVAEDAFKRQSQIDPKSSVALLGLGEVYQERHQYDVARQFYQRVSEMEPSNAAVHIKLGTLEEQSKDWSHAAGQYQKALQLDSSSAIAKNNLAWIYAEHGGSLVDAVRLARDASNALPADPHVSDTLGWLLFKNGSVEEALTYLRQSVARDPTNPLFHFHLGMVYASNHQLEAAKQQLETALHLNKAFEGSGEAARELSMISTNKEY